MIRSFRLSRTSGRPGHRRQLGALPAFDPISAGISAGVGLATDAVNQWMQSIQLSHDADTATTLIVNGLATQLSNLDAAYLAEDPPSCADQRAALDAYDQAWQWLQSPAACGNPNYGAAGNRCISDRAPGGKYPWATYYRDPIANDPRLINAGCDTSNEVILPSLATGTYQPSGVTAAGALDTTTAAAAAAPATSSAATSSAAITLPSTWPLYAALALGAYLVTRS